MAGDLRRGALGFKAAVSICAAMLAGCAATTEVAPPRSGMHLGCVDDSPRCLESRRIALQTILADRSRGWIAERPTAAAYASGVRLFAFMKLKRGLSCPELGAGLREAQAARGTLRAAAGRLTPAQIARGALLGDEVAKVMRREMRRRRCRATA
ncbi:MAG: hypothetical protein KDJ36_01805 [Hyphomicrobiaceae bacterium]|nr:hypothetical protein [Hyphomicrobiaceae bacterium]